MTQRMAWGKGVGLQIGDEDVVGKVKFVLFFGRWSVGPDAVDLGGGVAANVVGVALVDKEWIETPAGSPKFVFWRKYLEVGVGLVWCLVCVGSR